MTKQRRSFTPEFKREAATLVLDQGYSHIEASRAVGVGERVLRRWIKQLQQERNGITPQSKALTPEQQKIQELEAKINRLEREKAIIKNVWSAPDLQVRIHRRQRLRKCIWPTCGGIARTGTLNNHHAQIGFPRLLTLPRLDLPPVEYCRGTNPSHGRNIAASLESLPIANGCDERR